MRKIIFGSIFALFCFAANANAGSPYDGIWTDGGAFGGPVTFSTINTNGPGVVGNVAIVVNVDMTQTWWEALAATLTGPNTASFTTALPSAPGESVSGTVTFTSPTTATVNITACTPMPFCMPPGPFSLTKIW